MPPRKRKAQASGSEDDASTLTAPKATKKAKVSKATAVPVDGENAPNGQPTNKVLPVHITFPKRSEAAWRIVSWNICGWSASQKKGFKYYVEAEDPDVLILTETKVNEEPANPAIAARFPYRYWSISDKKTYGIIKAGTAILSKHAPLSTSFALPTHPSPSAIKGRLVTLEFAPFFLVGTYVTNAGTELKTLDAKNEWNAHFTQYIRALDAKKPVIWGGDLNVAPTAHDLANAKRNWNKTAGYTEAETSAFARILSGAPLPAPKDDDDKTQSPREEAKAEPPPDGAKFVDVWRALHPDDEHYTYFSYRFNCRGKGIGWRLDMFVVSERIRERIRMCEIRSEIWGASDHCPVVMEIEVAQEGGGEETSGERA